MIAVTPVVELVEVEGDPLALAWQLVASVLPSLVIQAMLCPDVLRAAYGAHAGPLRDCPLTSRLARGGVAG
jgi:hypothetical protein